MQNELLRLWDDVRFTVLFVTHSIEEAIIIGNRILLLSPHPGQVKAEFDAGPLSGVDGTELRDRIHDLLFSEQTEIAA
jgi:NitT/TauT family transport system ATP-binding protein